MKSITSAAALAVAGLLAACTSVPATEVTAPSPESFAEELLSADRAFAAAAKQTDLVSGIAAMLADDVVMPQQKLIRGKTEVIAALRANPANVGARATWAPVRGGISADGMHGFTYGYMTIEADGKPDRNAKYLAYWVKGQEGWRVAAYKRAPRPEGELSLPMPPVLPPRLLRATSEPGPIGRYRESLAQAERDFSAEAQTIGLGPAFAKYGRADAMNMGRTAAFTIGAENIGNDIGGAGEPSPLSWGPDEGVLVASSGDLGVTFGNIRTNGPPPEGQPAAIPFFTIWKRDSVSEPWRYVAE